MPEDIYVNKNFLTENDKVGDIRTVRGHEFIKQAVMVSAVEYTPDTPVGFTATAIEDRRSTIEEAVKSNQFTEPPITVAVEEIDQTDQRVVFQVETNSISFTLSQ